jgi:hypothetical protein
VTPQALRPSHPPAWEQHPRACTAAGALGTRQPRVSSAAIPKQYELVAMSHLSVHLSSRAQHSRHACAAGASSQRREAGGFLGASNVQNLNPRYRIVSPHMQLHVRRPVVAHTVQPSPQRRAGPSAAGSPRRTGCAARRRCRRRRQLQERHQQRCRAARRPAAPAPCAASGRAPQHLQRRQTACTMVPTCIVSLTCWMRCCMLTVLCTADFDCKDAVALPSA